jgi:hypothetical protein
MNCRDHHGLSGFLPECSYAFLQISKKRKVGSPPSQASEDDWHRGAIVSNGASHAELSLDDTETSVTTAAGTLGLRVYEQSIFSTHELWEPSPWTKESMSNLSSMCSSASTLCSAKSCSLPSLPHPSSNACSSSFDFLQRRALQHCPAECGFPAADAQLGSLSVGTGLAPEPPEPWRRHRGERPLPPSAAGRRESGLTGGQSLELEEFSLGPGRPF